MTCSLHKKGKKIFNNLKIKQKLIVLYFATFFVPFIIVTFILAIWLQQTLSAWQLRQAKGNIAQIVTLFKDVLVNAEKLSDSLYVNKAVQSTLLHEYVSTQEVYEQYLNTGFLDDFLRANRNIASFRYYTENQTILDNAYFIKTTQDIQNSFWYKTAKSRSGKLQWVMKTDSVTRKKMLSLVRSVWSSVDHKFISVLSINLDGDSISQLIKNGNNTTFIAVNQQIEFSSTTLPQNRRPSLLSSLITDDEPQVFYTQWEGKKSVVITESVFGTDNTSIVFVQIIPRTQLFATTIQGLFFYLFLMFCVLLFSFASILFFSFYFNTRISYLNNQINKVVANNFELGPRLDGTDEFAEIYDALFVTTLNIKKLIAEVYQRKLEQEQLLSRQNDIRFKMLASQINPHFLFNTLETIRMLAVTDGNKNVAHTIKLLANILRHNLSATDRPVLLTQEMDAVGNYLDIQHLRFADRVSYDIMYACDVHSIGILPLLIQPIVENSFIHGLESRQPGGFIYIIVDSDEYKNLYISIRDNGIGMSPERLEELTVKLGTGTVETISSSIGMVNVNQRIKLFYGDAYGLTVESEHGKGTAVTIHIPLVTVFDKCEGHYGKIDD